MSITGIAREETKGERKPPLNIALCFGRENGYRGEVFNKWYSRFARVGGESERAVSSNDDRPPPTTHTLTNQKAFKYTQSFLQRVFLRPKHSFFYVSAEKCLGWCQGVSLRHTPQWSLVIGQITNFLIKCVDKINLQVYYNNIVTDMTQSWRYRSCAIGLNGQSPYMKGVKHESSDYYG